MKTLKKLPRMASMPKQGSILPLVAAGLLILWSILSLVKPVAAYGGSIFSVVAGVLLLLRHKDSIVNPVAMYRWACVLLALEFLSMPSKDLLAISVLLLIASFMLRTNYMTHSGPNWLRRPIWALFILGALAVLIVDQLVYIIRDFKPAYFVQLLPLAALLLIGLSLGGYTLVKKKAPRMQAVPVEGSKLFAVGVVMLVCVLAFAFTHTLKSVGGFPVTESLRTLFADGNEWLTLENTWRHIVRFAVSLFACGLMLSAHGRKKHFLTAAVLLFFFMGGASGVQNAVTEVRFGMAAMSEAAVSTAVVLLLILLSAIGFTWNKRIGHLRISVLNLVALLVSVVLVISQVGAGVQQSKNAAENQKAAIVEAVKEASAEAVSDKAYSGTLMDTTCQTAYDAAYAAVREAAYDAAYAAAREVGVADVNMTPESIEKNAEEIAVFIGEEAAIQSMNGMEWEIYEAMTEMLAEVPAEAIAVQAVYDEAPAEPVDFRAEMKQEVQEYFYVDLDYSGWGTVGEMYAAAGAAAAEVVFEPAFETCYNTVYDAIYELLNTTAAETANATLEEYEGTVYLAVAAVVIRSLTEIAKIAALILIILGLTVQPAEKTQNYFKLLWNWCYQNVGEKLQKCMKLLGGIYLVVGFLGIFSIILALLMFHALPAEATLVLLGAGIAALIVTALNVIFTYPLFAFAQLSADVHALRDRVPSVQGQVSSASAEGTVEVPVKQIEAPAVTSDAEVSFNPDELPDL